MASDDADDVGEIESGEKAGDGGDGKDGVEGAEDPEGDNEHELDPEVLACWEMKMEGTHSRAMY